MDEFLVDKHKREVPDINVVPILDMLMCIIFFLVLSTSFVRLTQNSIPPSAKVTITDPVTPPPITARLIAIRENKNMEMAIIWSGVNPGYEKKSVNLEDETQSLRDVTTDLVHAITDNYPGEKTIQIGLGPNVTYQEMISIMDGAKTLLPDIILISYTEALTRYQTLNK